MGFTQLSKVLTTPLIAIIETSRGSAAPLNGPRILCLVLIHIGVFMASVADVEVNRTGTIVAFANVVVTARYKTEWSQTSRAAIAARRAARQQEGDDVLGSSNGATDLDDARDEQDAVRGLVEATLPMAALALVPAIVYFEGGVLLRCYATMDAAAYGRLLVVAILGAWTSSTGYMVIGRLSALTHQILGQFKMCCLLFGSYAFLGADLNARQLAGAAVTMAAVLLYTKCTIAQRAASGGHKKGDDDGGKRPLVDARIGADDALSPVRIRRSSSLRRGRNGGGAFGWGSWGGSNADAGSFKAPAFVA